MKNYQFNKKSFNIGIIGFGPKGLYALERLLAQIADMDLTADIHVHLFNETEYFGAGDVYRSDQPLYLLMNFCNHKINMWTKESPKSIVKKPLHYVDWLSNILNCPSEKIRYEYSPRRLVGEYLKDGFNELCLRAPVNVYIIRHIDTVINIKQGTQGYLIEKNGKDKYPSVRFHKLLFTTGNRWNGARFNSMPEFSPNIPFIYPVQDKLEHIESQSVVAVKGMGLTFIDAVLALTEGRGGKFIQQEDGGYKYISSGREPVRIFPFSRTGIPMIPRLGEPEHPASLQYFSYDLIKKKEYLKEVNFEHSLLPLIIREFMVRYYRVLFEQHGTRLRLSPDIHEIMYQIEEFHDRFPYTEKFDWDYIVNPFPGDPGPTHEMIVSYIDKMTVAAQKGRNNSPLIAAVSTWRDISPYFNEIYSYGGLNASSHKIFDEYYFGIFNRISYGPPIGNTKKILALAKADVINFGLAKKPNIKYDTNKRTYQIASQNDNQKAICDYLIDARIPKHGDRNESNCSLYANLLKNGYVRLYKNKDETEYIPGCVDLDIKGCAIDSHGYPNPDLTFYGIPTEGITFDNDTLSRERNNFASKWAVDTCLEIKNSTKTYQ